MTTPKQPDAEEALETFGYKVLTASDGTEALAVFAQHLQEVSCVITDMMMPFMDGPATIRALRKLRPQLKIIATSGLKANGKAVEAANLGVTTFLQKPYTAEALAPDLPGPLGQKRRIARAGLRSSLVQSGDAAGAAAKRIRLDAHAAQHGNK
jgi:CheY-like chemotaxis protein